MNLVLYTLEPGETLEQQVPLLTCIDYKNLEAGKYRITKSGTFYGSRGYKLIAEFEIYEE